MNLRKGRPEEIDALVNIEKWILPLDTWVQNNIWQGNLWVRSDKSDALSWIYLGTTKTTEFSPAALAQSTMSTLESVIFGFRIQKILKKVTVKTEIGDFNYHKWESNENQMWIMPINV